MANELPITSLDLAKNEEQIEDERHCHKPRQEGVDKKARNKLIIASFLCCLFMIMEVVGGIVSNSLAIASDAAHLSTDLLGFFISLTAIWIAGRKSTTKFSFGWYRAEVIGAICSVLIIWVITAILVYFAIIRVIYLDFEVDARIMVITALVAIVFNIIMACQLNHGHGHGHSHNINVRAAFIHVLGDFIQSVGVLVAALLIYFLDWKLADPICTFVFSVIVLATTFSILRDALQVLMEGTPRQVDYNEISRIIQNIPGVVRLHGLHIWALSINKVSITAHIVINKTTDPEFVIREANNVVREKFSFFETTFQVEQFCEDMDQCDQCILPTR